MVSRISFLFHVHTNRSIDCMMPMKSVLRYCKRRGIGIVAVCEHNYLMPSSQRKSFEREYGVRIVPAVEYATNCGDLIAMELEEFIRSRDCHESIDVIKDNAGMVVLPHPFRGHKLDSLPMEKIDMIEVFNGRCSEAQNSAAANLALNHKKIGIAGCDAHFPWELGLALNEIDVPSEKEDPIKSPLDSIKIVHQGRGLPRINSFMSQAIKAVRTPLRKIS